MNSPLNTQINTADIANTGASNTADWVDRKYYLWLLSPAIPVIGLGALIAYRTNPRKLRALTWFGPLLIHAVIPLLDKLIGEDSSNPPEAVINTLERKPYYAALVKSFIPLQYLTSAFALQMASRTSTPLLDKIGLTISMGVLNGVAFTTSHELSHKKTPSIDCYPS